MYGLDNLEKWMSPSHPLTRKSLQTFSVTSASCQPEQALEGLILIMLEQHIINRLEDGPTLNFQMFTFERMDIFHYVWLVENQLI